MVEGQRRDDCCIIVVRYAEVDKKFPNYGKYWISKILFSYTIARVILEFVVMPVVCCHASGTPIPQSHSTDPTVCALNGHSTDPTVTYSQSFPGKIPLIDKAYYYPMDEIHPHGTGSSSTDSFYLGVSLLRMHSHGVYHSWSRPLDRGLLLTD